MKHKKESSHYEKTLLIYLLRNKLLCPVVTAFYIANTDVSEAII